MKRILSMLLLFSCLLALCACGSPAAETPAEPSAEPVDPTAAPADPTAQPTHSVTEADALAAPVYPSMAPQPNQADYLGENGWEVSDDYFDALRAWWADLDALRQQPEGYADALAPWFAGSIRQFLSGGEGENRVCSPLNVTMALAMLAEVTDGESRQQILELLGAPDLDALRARTQALWKVSYQDDGLVKSVLANSLWLREGMGYRAETLENLAAYYYAASFSGQMGSPEYDALLQAWINEQTGGLLQEQASGLQMSPETVLALVSTIYFKAPWTDSFPAFLTAEGLFHSPDGDQTVDFMHRSDTTSYYWGERFGAAGLGMGNNGTMWLLLPDEGVTPEELLRDEEAMSFLLLPRKTDWEQQKTLQVNYTVPKFDVSSDLNLIDSLKALGIQDVFDPSISDFSPLTADTDELYVSQVKHAARVLIDEEGCEAAAYTVILVAEAAAFEEPEPEEIDFILDRPFLFVITNAGGLPLFVGVVNHPVG